MKILVTNTVALNGGDAAILKSLLMLLCQIFGSEAEIHVYGRRTDVARRYYPDLAFHNELYGQLFQGPKSAFLKRVYARLARTYENPAVFRFYVGASLYGRGARSLAKVLLPRVQFEALQQYASADLIISTGGTYLVEHYSLDPNIFDLMTAVLLRKPLVLFTQSLGPFANRKYRKLLRFVFRRAAAILLRDERSAQHISQLGLSGGNTHVTADVVFALADPYNWRQAVRAGRKLRVSISVREWAHFRQSPAMEAQARYLASVRELLTHMVRDHDAEVVFLSTCQGIPEYTFDDSRYAAQLCDTLPADIAQHVVVDNAFHSPEELMELLRGFDLVISTRLHMAILALSAGVPALTIAYEFKSLELYRNLGHENLSHDIETMTGETLIQCVDDVLANLSRVRDSLREATLLQRERVHKSAAHLKRTYQTVTAGLAATKPTA